MKSSANNSDSKSSKILFGIIFLVLIGAFFFLQPKVSSQLFSFQNNQRLNSFINSTQESQALDPKKYWELREFYSPGSFNYYNNGASISAIQNLDLSESIMPMIGKSIILVYRSKKINSIEGLTNETNLSGVLTNLPGKILVDKPNLKLIIIPNGYIVAYIKSQDEIKKATGFLERTNKNLLTKKNWFSVSEIAL